MIPRRPNLADLARGGYEAYGKATGNKNFRGDPMPHWHELPAPIHAAWMQAAHQIIIDSTTLDPARDIPVPRDSPTPVGESDILVLASGCNQLQSATDPDGASDAGLQLIASAIGIVDRNPGPGFNRAFNDLLKRLKDAVAAFAPVFAPEPETDGEKST